VPVPIDVTSAPETPAIEILPDDRTPLDVAIARGYVTVHRDLVVAPAILGHRRWYDAMTTCRARPFWTTRGWRVPTRKELVALARVHAIPRAPAWSSSRAGRDSAFIIDGADAAVTPEAKAEASAITICVRRR
jgi:hypothetical protein